MNKNLDKNTKQMKYSYICSYCLFTVSLLVFTSCNKKLSETINHKTKLEDRVIYHTYNSSVSLLLDLQLTEEKYSLTVRDDLWSHMSHGEYRITEDSIVLDCKNDCKFDYPFGDIPVVLEGFCSEIEQEAYKIGTTNYQALEGYRAARSDNQDMPNNCFRQIQIFNTEDDVVYEHCVTDLKANCFQFIFSGVSLYSSLLNFDKKNAKIKGDSIEFSNNIILIKSGTINFQTKN